MATDTLAEAIAREADENPFLILHRRAGPSGAAYEFALATTAATESLSDSLTRQVHLQRLDPQTEAAALYLMCELREDGYLDVSLDELCRETGQDLAVLGAGLSALQACDPPGIGARSLAECLALQLTGEGMVRELADSVAARLDAFADQNWRTLGRELGLPRAELQSIARRLRTLSHAPVPPEHSEAMTNIPELVVEKNLGGRLEVSLNDEALPRVEAMRVLRSSLGAPALQSLFDRAQELARGLAARKTTLLRIGIYLAERQSGFFAARPTGIAPLSRKEAAAALGIHPSTLGRAISGKSLSADGKVYPLWLFFQRGLPGSKGEISAFDVQSRISALISAEDHKMPLADEDICTQLKKEGVDIARRTVAKYRKCMRIPSSHDRKIRKPSDPETASKAPSHRN